MWISKRITQQNKNEMGAISGEITGVQSETVNVQNSNEYREISTIAPAGIAYVPVEGAKTVVLPMADTAVCVGVITEDKNLQPGELMLYSAGGASILLKNDGTVWINGSEFETTGGE